MKKYLFAYIYKKKTMHFREWLHDSDIEIWLIVKKKRSRTKVFPFAYFLNASYLPSNVTLDLMPEPKALSTC